MEKIWYDHTSGEWSGDEYGYGQAVSGAKAPEGGVCTLYSPVGDKFLFGQTVSGHNVLSATSGFCSNAGEVRSYAADFLAARRRERGERVAVPSERDLALALRAADLLLAGTKPVILCLPKEEDVAAANARAESITSLTVHLFGKKYAERLGFLCFTEYFPSDLPSMRLHGGELEIRLIVSYGAVDPSFDASFAVIRPGDDIPAAPASRYLQVLRAYLHDCGADYEFNARALVEKGEGMPVYCGGKLRALFEGGSYDELADYAAASRAYFALRGNAESAALFLKAYAECGYAEESALPYAEELRRAVRVLQGSVPDEGMLRCLFGMFGRRECALHGEAGAALAEYCDISKTDAAIEDLLLRLADGISEKGGSRAAFLVLLGISCFKSGLRDKARLARADGRIAEIAARLPSSDPFEGMLSWCLYLRRVALARTDKRTRLRETPAAVLDGLLGRAAPEDIVAAVSASWEGAEGLQGKYLQAAGRAAGFFGAEVSECKDMLSADPALKKRVVAEFYSAPVYSGRAAKGAAALYAQKPYAEVCRAAADSALSYKDGNRRAALDDSLVTCSLRRQEFDRAAPKELAAQAEKTAAKAERQEKPEQLFAAVVSVCVAVILVLSALLLVLPPAVYPDSFAGEFWENVLAYLREWPVSFFFPAAALIIFGVCVSVLMHDRDKGAKGGRDARAAWMETLRKEMDRRRFLLFCAKSVLFSLLPAIFYDLVWMIVYFIH